MLSIAALIVVMLFGLLPGLLAGLAAFSLTKWLTSRLPSASLRLAPYAGVIAASLVVAAPLLVLTLAGVELSKFLTSAASNYAALTAHVVDVAMDLKNKVPEGFRALFPETREEIQVYMKGALHQQFPTLAGLGRSWAAALLFVVVGVIVGALIAVSTAQRSDKPLAAGLRERAAKLSHTFISIVLAQFWIASINTALTALFLFVLLPVFANAHIPYSGWLVLLTFVAGMLPIVGNLLCNVVITLAGLGVGPHIGLMCILFLIAVHKFEYLINAKVVGSAIRTSAWEIIVAMFVLESLFGVAGLVAAPLYYAYLKTELRDLGWV